MRARCTAWLALAVAVGWACAASRGFDLQALVERNPGLARESARRLGETMPYVLPLGDRLTLFLCRWRDAAPVRVSLPPDASPRERALLERALEGWRQALPALQLAPAREGVPAQIEIRFDAEDPERTATTAADCRIGLAPEGSPTQLDAGLVEARIALRRAALDWRGHEQALSDEELLGSALHELGHALGYQGHARRGATVMLRSVDAVRLAGRRRLAGAPFADAALAGLYGVPSGSVIECLALPRARTADIDRLAVLARRRAWMGPILRVGDESARIAWRNGAGAELGFFIPRVGEVLRDPDRLVALPFPGTSIRLGAETTR